MFSITANMLYGVHSCVIIRVRTSKRSNYCDTLRYAEDYPGFYVRGFIFLTKGIKMFFRYLIV